MPRPAHRFQSLPAYPLAHIPIRKRELLAAGRGRHRPRGRGRGSRAAAGGDRGAEPALEEPAMHRYGFGLGHVPFREAVSAWMQRRFGLSLRSDHGDLPADRLEGGASRTSSIAFLEQGRRGGHPRARLPRLHGRHAARRGHAVPVRAPPAHQLPRRAGRDPRRRAAAHEAALPELPEQPDRRDRAARLPRARRADVPRARHPARVRQRVLRAGVRRLRAAEHLRDRRARATSRSSSTRCRRRTT